MGSNAFGKVFRCTTWGESHGKAIGVVIDGCPAGVKISEEEINAELLRRAPGNNPLTSQRREPDCAEILSGIFDGQTTGAPISILIWNRDGNKDAYEPIKDILRPGHANFTYLQKYSVFDYRGGGRASARETACRVAAGAIAKKILSDVGIGICGFLRQVGEITGTFEVEDLPQAKDRIAHSSIFCPCPSTEAEFIQQIEKARDAGDSIGGLVEAHAWGIPPGLGDPVYSKLDALLASALLSIPACKSFEIGSGKDAAGLHGSQHNDLFIKKDTAVISSSNNAGGTLGGISTGMPLVIKAAFKPAASIALPQRTLDTNGQTALLTLPRGSRHDPCIAVRAVSVVEAMMALVLVDLWLMNRLAKI